MWISIVILGILVLLYYRYKSESFEEFNKSQMAERIVKWFAENPQGSYSQYKRDFDRKSNIVEYEDARLLALQGKLTIETMIAKL